MIKVGDIVVRKIEKYDVDWICFLMRQGLQSKRQYKVTAVSGNYIQLEGLKRGSDLYPWHIHNFIVVGREPECSDTVQPKADMVKSPKHYQFFPDVEAIEIIAGSMTVEGFRGYCMGNRLKYRLRAGNKDKLEQDIAKSDFYVELFNKHKHLCKDA